MFDPNDFKAPDAADERILGVRFAINGRYEGPFHAHRKAQLFHATEGVITVETPDGLWVTPPYRAVWVPTEVEHTVRGSGIREIFCLYLEPDVSRTMPTTCCVLAVSPMLREMILRFVARDEEQLPAMDPVRRSRLAQVIVDELEVSPREAMVLPMPRERRTRKVAEAMLSEPEIRRGLAEWGDIVGASTRTLARHFLKETGVSFGSWRQQLDLALAVQMLGEGEAVQAVARRLGYEAPSSFIAMFRKAMGCTPARYLQAVRGVGSKEEA